MKIVVRTGIILLTSTLSVFGQVDNEALTKIKTESDKNSQVMKIVSYLSDVYGPRLMGTPNYYNSILWTEEQLKKWGIEKIEQQSFDKGHRGWEVVNFKMELVEPTHSFITAYPLAYTSSTKGEVIGEVMYISNFDSIYTLSGQDYFQHFLIC